MSRGRAILGALLGLGVAACSAVPMPSLALLPQPGPIQVVGKALGAVIDHDLPAASLTVCPEARDAGALPFDVGPIFLPLGSLGDRDDPAALALVTITPVGVEAAAETVDEESSIVHVTGGLDLLYDLPATRAYAERIAGGTDPALVERVMLVAGDGSLEVSLDARVPVQRRDGAWMICGGEMGIGG